MFVIISVIYRPIEQLLSRTIAERRARGHAAAPAARADAIQACASRSPSWSLALAFTRTADQQRLRPLSAPSTTCWSSARSPTPPATSPAAGWPGNECFGLFGGLVLMESLSRLCFALAVALGIASGQTAVALGIAAAPLVSLVVVPAAFARRARSSAKPSTGSGRRRRDRSRRRRGADESDHGRRGRRGARRARAPRACRRPRPTTTLSLRRGAGFAVWVSGIMLSEQTLLNAAVLTVDATSTQQSAGGDRLQRAADRARSAAALPGDPDLAAAPPDGPRGDGGPRRVRPRDPHHRARDRRLRRRRRARAAGDRPVRDGAPVRAALHLQPRRPGADRGGHGPAPAPGRSTRPPSRATARARPPSAGCSPPRVFLGWMLVPAVGEQLLRTEIGYAGATALLAAAAVAALPPAASRDRRRPGRRTASVARRRTRAIAR